MSHVVGKERCPNCAKMLKDRRGDNLATYSDGHKFCFSCGYYVHGNLRDRILSKRVYQAKVADEPNGSIVYEPNPSLYLPEDVVPCTYGVGYEWLKKYEINTYEILQNKIVWSEQKQWLIFPFYSNGELQAFQARNFNKDKPYKYFTQGDIKDVLWILSPSHSDHLVLVEDIISAIKVSRQFSSMPILGSVINTHLLNRLKSITTGLTIWLDPDKRKDMIKFSGLCQSYGFKTKTIFSELDPKEHTDKEITEYVQN